MGKHKLTIAKATEDDLKNLELAFQIIENIAKYDASKLSDFKPVDEKAEELIGSVFDQYGHLETDLLFDLLYKLCSGYYRVTIGYNCLLERCANPDIDHIDFNNDIKEAFWLWNKIEASLKENKAITFLPESEMGKSVIFTESDIEETYLVWSKQYVGNSLLFWREGKAGYTTDINKAHHFTYEDALKIQDGSDHKLIPYSHLNKIATRQVHNDHLDRNLIGKEAANV